MSSKICISLTSQICLCGMDHVLAGNSYVWNLLSTVCVSCFTSLPCFITMVIFLFSVCLHKAWFPRLENKNCFHCWVWSNISIINYKHIFPVKSFHTLWSPTRYLKTWVTVQHQSLARAMKSEGETYPGLKHLFFFYCGFLRVFFFYYYFILLVHEQTGLSIIRTFQTVHPYLAVMGAWMRLDSMLPRMLIY